MTHTPATYGQHDGVACVWCARLTALRGPTKQGIVQYWCQACAKSFGVELRSAHEATPKEPAL